MAVGVEFLGQQVQCPTCGQIVLAPAAAPPPALDHTPEFTAAPKQEGLESIFSDEVHDEDVFGTPRPKVEMPAASGLASLPTNVPPPLPSPNGPTTTGFAAAPPGVPQVAPGPPADVALTVAAPLAPEVSGPGEEAAPAPSAGISWSKISDTAPAAPWPPPDAQPDTGVPAFPDVEGQSTAGPMMSSAPRRQSSNLLLTILVPYAVLATAIAVYYMWRFHSTPAETNALETFPDAIRIIDKPISPKTGGAIALPQPDSALAAKLKTKLGESIEVGDLAVTPLRIERGRLQIFSILKDDSRTGPRNTPEGLTLFLRIRNRSRSLDICPTDPMYNRQFHPEFSEARPYTLLEVGNEKFYGGPIDVYSARAKREFVAGQENDERPLGPGEERQTVTCTNPWNEKILTAVTNAKDAMLWRVQLRKGQVSFHGRDVPVCTVIGVEFTAADIKRAASN
jgi:hypothetical protein